MVALSAHAAIKINSVDESRVSNIRGLNTTDVTIFGGTAGTCARDNNSTETTCTSCVAGGSGDSSLVPCNDRRINPNLVMLISITSDSQASGYPAMVVTPTGGGTPVRLGYTSSQSAVSKGSQGTISVRWADICNQMPVTSPGTISNCIVSGVDNAILTVTIGMKSVNDTNTFASGDDQTTIKIKLVPGPASGSPLYLAQTGGNGITYFEVTSGDQKGTLSTLSCTPGSGFPNSQNIRFQWVRVLFEKRANENTPAWTNITPGSPHTDLQISDTGSCDDKNLDLTPIAIQGGTATDNSGNQSTVNIENTTDLANKKIYDMKVAVVDEARNVYLYTPAGNDQDCNNNPASRDGTNSRYECHTIRPVPVTGVLANKTNCFVATASYGSPMANEVDTFRHFRDTYLIPTKLGLKFVRWYYEHGPAYAAFIKQSDTYRAIARGFLWLPLQFAKVSLSYGLFAGISFLTFTLFAPFALLAWMINRRRSARV